MYVCTDVHRYTRVRTHAGTHARMHACTHTYTVPCFFAFATEIFKFTSYSSKPN